jgi:hypothetical protein
LDLTCLGAHLRRRGGQGGQPAAQLLGGQLGHHQIAQGREDVA